MTPLRLMMFDFPQRGKFRPRLMPMVQSNNAETVREATAEAFQCLPDLDKAMGQATRLKAVGPATASGETS